MKKTLKYVALAAATIFTMSCSNDPVSDGIEKSNSYITATQEALTEENSDFALVRTTLNSQNAVEWNQGDEISVYDGTRNTKFTASTAGATATFLAPNYEATASRYIASYPYNIATTFSGNTISNITLPSNQVATDGSFDPACNLMTASTTSIASGLNFKHICSYIKIIPAFDCSRIVIDFNDNVTGTFDVTVADDGTPSVSNLTDASQTIILHGNIKALTSYYIAVLPGSYTKGFKVTLEPKLTKEMVNWETKTINTTTYYRQAPVGNTLVMNRAKIRSLGTMSTANMTANNPDPVSFEDMGYGDDINAAHGKKVLWATANLGAKSETEYGDYYAWGEIAPRTNAYSYANYLCKDYYPVNLDLAHDAAAVHMGRGWKIPSDYEFNELKERTIWVYTTNYNGKTGYLVYPAGKKADGTPIQDYQKLPNGTVYRVPMGLDQEQTVIEDQEVIAYINNLSPETTKHLFIIYAGFKNIDGTIMNLDKKATYWTNGRGETEMEAAGTPGSRSAFYLGADNSKFNMKSHWNTVYNGMSIRPVMVLEW